MPGRLRLVLQHAASASPNTTACSRLRMNWAKRQQVTPDSARFITYPRFTRKRRFRYTIDQRGSMLKQSSENTTSTQERRSTRVIFYNLSYIVQGAEHGTDGAIVLLHDIIGGATAWRDLLPHLSPPNKPAYAIHILGYRLSNRPCPPDTS